MKIIISNSICVLLIIFSGTQFVSAKSDISVQVNKVVIQFPKGVFFRLDAVSDVEIESIVLTYGTNARTCRANSAHRRVDFDPSSNVNVSWEWDWRRSGIQPPGAEIWWQWELKDISGSSVTTPIKRILIQDQRYDWNILHVDGVSVQWYQGDENFGKALLAITTESREKLTQYFGLPGENDVNIVVYPSSEELQEALLVTTEWTGGVAISDFSTIIIALDPDNLDWSETIIPHELCHVAVSSLVFNCRGVLIPRWLDEGLTENAENPPTREEKEIIVSALEDRSLPKLSTLDSGFSAYGKSAYLSYLHSKFIVDFLISEHGNDRLMLLLSTLQDGNPVDSALEKVYGYETNQLDNAWRASVGFPGARQNSAELINEISTAPAPIPTLALMVPVRQVETTATPDQEKISSTPIAAVIIPTIAPTRTPYPTPIVQNQSSTPPNNQESTGFYRNSIILIAGVVLLAVALLFSKKWRG